MKTLGLILARSGSKRLPGKNLKNLCGKPLVAWSIETALSTSSIDKVLVSTDSTEIQTIALKYGAQAPFLRPESLSTDEATSADAAIHALDWAEQKWGPFDAVALLEPTSPLRRHDDIKRGIDLLKENFEKADGVVSVGAVHLEHPKHCKQIKEGMIQPIPVGDINGANPVLFPYGVLYLIKSNVLRAQRSFYAKTMLPLPIERWQNYEVDDLYDFACIEAIMKMKMGDIRL